MSDSAITVSLKWKRERDAKGKDKEEYFIQQANNTGEAKHFSNNPEKSE